MHPRSAFLGSAILVVAVALFGLAGPARAFEVNINALMAERTLMLQGYIEHYAADHGGAYPAADLVQIGGGLEAPVWPNDPWTGAAMQPGTIRGCFTYTLAPDGKSYTLVGHRLRRDVRFSGGGATSLDAERDARAAVAAELLRQYILDYASDNNFARPAPAQVSSTGDVGTHAEAGAWPKNPWTGQAMKAGSAVGDFVYTADPDWHHFSLAVKTTTGTAMVSGDTYASPWKARRDTYRDQVTKLGTALIRDAIEQWAFDNDDAYPSEWDVDAHGGVGMFFIDVDWPVNPFTNAPMADEFGDGAFDYELQGIGDSFTITGDLTGSATYQLGPSFEQYKERKFRSAFKDLVAQRSIQVIKAYVDHWADTHGGTPPSQAQLTSSGAVGVTHTWWPTNPWDMSPMGLGSDYGEYTYTPGAGGSYTLVLHEAPDPEWPADYPADYLAE